MKRWIGLVLATLTLGALAGCGEDTEAYCDDLDDAGKAISAVDDAKIDYYYKALPKINDLKEQAPDDVQGDWKVFANYMEAAKSYYDSIAKMSDNPDDVSTSDTQQLHANKPKDDDPDVDKASKNIHKHAKDTCEIDLDG